jgi:P-type Cu2+ transporter
VIFFYGGWPFLTGGWQEARARTPRDDAADLDGDHGRLRRLDGDLARVVLQEVWWELALLIAIMLLGHWIEMRAIGQARGALAALPSCCPTRPSGSGRRGSTSRRSPSVSSGGRRRPGPPRRAGSRPTAP